MPLFGRSLVRAMVLSNKKLKQRLRAEAALQQGSLLSTPDKSKPINKREKKRRRRQPLESPPAQQPEALETSPIDQAELDTYHRCIETLLHESDSGTSLRQGHGEEEVSDILHSPVKQGQDAEVTLPTLVNNGHIVSTEDNSSLPKPSDMSEKPKKASKMNTATEEQEEKAPNNSAEDQDASESRTVYVGGIPYYSSEDDIKTFFSDCGTISEINLKTFSDSGKFCGIALLTFKTTGGVQRALGLNGASMGDRFLKIQPSAAKPKEAAKKEVYDAPPTKTEGYTRAYIGNLSWSVTEEDIREFFKGCKIDKVKFSEDKVTGDFRGFGHVDFVDDESLERALQLDQQILLERPIKVAYAVPSKSEKRAGTASRDSKDISCYTCGEKGHVSSRCPYMGRGQ